MAGFDTVIYEKRDRIAYITLNRTRYHNAVNTRMRDELFDLLGALREDPDVLVAIFKGAGDRAFSAGADISEFGTAPSRVIARKIRWQRDLWGLFLSIEKPLIAAVHGYALGAGCEMAMCCDLRVASEDASFGLPEVTLGMIPAAGGSQTLPRLVPRGKAAEMVITGSVIDAAEAYRIGLVNKVVRRSELLPAAEEWAHHLASLSQPAVRCAKQAIVGGVDLNLEQGLRLEARLYAALMGARSPAKGKRLSPGGRRHG